MFSVLIFSLTINLSSGFNPDSTKVVSTELADTSYAENIRIADSEFTLKYYLVARHFYQKALSLKPGDKYSLDQIVICDYEENEQSARKLEEQYQLVLVKANEYFDTLNFLCARDFYFKADGMKPNNVFVKERIVICNENLQGVAEYNACIKEADLNFANERYLQAWGFYNRALAIGGDADEYLKNQIILTKEKEREQTVKEVERQYQLILAKANEYFLAQCYNRAKEFYTRAISIKPTDTFALERIKICEEEAKNESTNCVSEDLFEKIVKKANEYVDAGDYQAAKNFYSGAIKLHPDDVFVKNRIIFCDDKLKN